MTLSIFKVEAMSTDLRKSGIEILGDIPWGTHICQFYDTKKDLLELLVPYFQAGLENNEFCLWLIADPITEDDAWDALRKTIPYFQKYTEKKSIEISSYNNWFMPEGKFNGDQVATGWLQKLEEVQANGFDGLRINGIESWLGRNGWNNFIEYEQSLKTILKNRQIIGLCTYPLSKADGEMVLDVAHAHEAVIAKRKGRWEILEEPEIKKIKHDELEQRVAERTRQLDHLIKELRRENAERKKAEEQLKESYQQVRLLSEHLQNIQEAEQTRIAHELHDELGQELTVLRLNAAWLKEKIEVSNENKVVRNKFEDHLAMIDAALQSVKRIASQLRPAVLEELGLIPAMEGHLEEFERHTDIRTYYERPETPLELPDRAKTALFRIFQESLTNVAKYARASEVRVSLFKNDHLICLSIQDNGVGFDPEQAKKKKTLGILGMKERARHMGGDYRIQSEPGKGTIVSVQLPIQ